MKKKMTYTRKRLRKITDVNAYEKAAKIYMAETGKFPPKVKAEER